MATFDEAIAMFPDMPDNIKVVLKHIMVELKDEKREDVAALAVALLCILSIGANQETKRQLVAGIIQYLEAKLGLEMLP